MVVEDDFHGLLEILGVLSAGGASLFQNVNRHAQPSAGLGAFDELLGDVHRVENHSLTGSRDMSKHTMLDWIVLRAVRWIMRHANLQAQTCGQMLQVLLEQVLRRTVAPATVA